MKNFIVFLLIFIVLFNISLFAKKVASLPEVEKPSYIDIEKGRLFVSDSNVKLHLYWMKDFSYKLITKRGEGPGETRFHPYFWTYPDRIFTYSSKRGMFFSLDGELQKEIKIPLFSLSKACPIGKNFVVYQGAKNPKKGHTELEMSIYEYSEKQGFQYKKIIYYRDIKTKIIRGKKRYPLIRPYFGFLVKDDRVFIGDCYRGFCVEIYDNQGNEAGKIKLFPDKVKVSEDFIKRATNVLKSPKYDRVKSMYHIDFPEYYPDFYRFDVDKQKVYFLTYKKQDKYRELIITDYNGKILKRSYVPWVENEATINFAINNDKFYYIEENEDTEEWELHVEDIK